MLDGRRQPSSDPPACGVMDRGPEGSDGGVLIIIKPPCSALFGASPNRISQIHQRAAVFSSVQFKVVVAESSRVGYFKDVLQGGAAGPQAGEEPTWACLARRRQTLLRCRRLTKVGREGGRHHRGGQRHRQGDGRRVRPERRQGRPRRRPGRPGPRARRGPRRGLGLLHALRRDRRVPGRRGRGPRRRAPRKARCHVQQRRGRGVPGAAGSGRAGPRRLRLRPGGEHPGRGGRGEARGAGHGAAAAREHNLHGEHRGGARHADAAPVQRLQGGRGGAGARRGRGGGALGSARQRRLAQLHRDAAGDAHPGGVVPGDERRGAQAHRGEGHERDGRGGAGAGGHCQGGAVPGLRRVQVRERPQPRRRRRLHGGEGA